MVAVDKIDSIHLQASIVLKRCLEELRHFIAITTEIGCFVRVSVFFVAFLLTTIPSLAIDLAGLQKIRKNSQEGKISQKLFEEQRDFILQHQNPMVFASSNLGQRIQVCKNSQIIIREIAGAVEKTILSKTTIVGISNNSDQVFEFQKNLQNEFKGCEVSIDLAEEVPLFKEQYYVRFQISIKEPNKRNSDPQRN